jgi:F-type H+-transporting ATPase subunit alpha
MNVPIKVTIVDDHTITREGIKELLNQDFSNRFHVVGDFSNGKEFLNFLEAKHADVLVSLKAGKYTDEITDVLTKCAKEIAEKFN